jgi:hypothetical protein
MIPTFSAATSVQQNNQAFRPIGTESSKRSAGSSVDRSVDR